MRNSIFRDNEIYWATIGYYRWWLAVDGPMVRRAGRLTPELLRQIASWYAINRGLTKKAAPRVIEILHREADIWPDNLRGRAERCAAIATECKLLKHTKKRQASAATKLMWFLKPDGWTMFDKMAADGLRGTSRYSSVERMLAFYDRLQTFGFEALSRDMQAVIDASKVPSFPAARVIDGLLMIRGGRTTDMGDIPASRSFLELLPPPGAAAIEKLAETLQHRFGNAVLTQPVPVEN